VGVSFIVSELRVHVVVDIPDVLQGGRPAENIVSSRLQERLSLFGLLFELVRGVNSGDVFFESWATSPALQRKIVVRLDSFNWNVLVPSKRSNDNTLVGQRDLVLWVWWE